MKRLECGIESLQQITQLVKDQRSTLLSLSPERIWKFRTLTIRRLYSWQLLWPINCTLYLEGLELVEEWNHQLYCWKKLGWRMQLNLQPDKSFSPFSSELNFLSHPTCSKSSGQRSEAPCKSRAQGHLPEPEAGTEAWKVQFPQESGRFQRQHVLLFPCNRNRVQAVAVRPAGPPPALRQETVSVLDQGSAWKEDAEVRGGA